MNNNTVVMIVIAAFVEALDLGALGLMNFDQIAGDPDPNAKPEGTLLYFYAPS